MWNTHCRRDCVRRDSIKMSCDIEQFFIESISSNDDKIDNDISPEISNNNKRRKIVTESTRRGEWHRKENGSVWGRQRERERREEMKSINWYYGECLAGYLQFTQNNNVTAHGIQWFSLWNWCEASDLSNRTFLSNHFQFYRWQNPPQQQNNQLERLNDWTTTTI